MTAYNAILMIPKLVQQAKLLTTRMRIAEISIWKADRQSGAKGTKVHSGNGDDNTTKSDNTHTLTHSNIQTFSVFPNPTTGHFNIENYEKILLNGLFSQSVRKLRLCP